MADIEMLKRLAEAAAEIDSWYEGRDFHAGGICEMELDIVRSSDRDFIIAASPAAVLALIAENERLRQIISDSATACGAAMSAECTVEFMGHLPAEIAGVLKLLRAELPAVERGEQ